jgi:hypothetical protein
MTEVLVYRHATARAKLPVVMVENPNGGWDAHITVVTDYPYLVLGKFVLEGLKNPAEFESRFKPAFDEFVNSLDGPYTEEGN